METGKLSEYEGELEELVKTDGKDGPNRTSEHSRGWILHLLKDIKRTESNVFSLNPRNRFLPVPGLWLIQPLLPYTRPLSHKRIRRAPLPPSKKEVAFKEGKWNVIQDKWRWRFGRKSIVLRSTLGKKGSFSRYNTRWLRKLRESFLKFIYSESRVASMARMGWRTSPW